MADDVIWVQALPAFKRRRDHEEESFLKDGAFSCLSRVDL